MHSDAERELAVIREVLAPVAPQPDLLLPTLLELQRRLGHVSNACVATTAQHFNLSRADVHGVATFYHDLRSEPVGRHLVQICQAEACQAVGCRALAAHAERRLGVAIGTTSSAAGITLEAAYCFGNCACGPTIRIDDAIHGRVTAERFDALVAAALDADVLEAAPPGQPTLTTRMTTRVFVPNDTSACSLGADAVAGAIESAIVRHRIDARVIRNGSRGAYALEPLVEIETPAGRIGFSRVEPTDVAALFAAGLPDASHPACIGLVDDLPFLKRQQRLTFARAGVIDPLDYDAYRANGGLEGLTRARTLTAAEIVEEIRGSGLRGRGGAAFPAAIKWQTVLDASGPTKYIVCNADEGDSGTFADRLLIEADPFQLIEGMLIAALTVGADRGYVYLRSEYPRARDVLTAALNTARRTGLLGRDACGAARAFDIELRTGAGAYVCGEETSLLESLEGKRALVRFKPPVPAISGLFGKPTLIHNVLTLAAVTTILGRGGSAYAAFGSGRSRGTMPFQLGGNIANGGIVELAFGTTLRRVLQEFGGGSRSGRPLRAVQIGGPLGAYLPPSLWDTPLDYEAFAAIAAMLGHGGIVAFDDSVDLGEQAQFAMQFCAHESCGKCTPCRIGSVRGVEVIQRIRQGDHVDANVALLEDLCETMETGSLCALGGLTPMPVRSILKHFRGDLIPG